MLPIIFGLLLIFFGGASCCLWDEVVTPPYWTIFLTGLPICVGISLIILGITK